MDSYLLFNQPKDCAPYGCPFRISLFAFTTKAMPLLQGVINELFAIIG